MTFKEALPLCKGIVVHGMKILESLEEERKKGCKPEDEDV